MNQETKYYLFIWLLFGVTSIILQSLLVPFIEINLWKPDLVLIIVLLSGKRFGSALGSTSGFTLGLIQDSLTGMPVGITAFPKSLVGYFAGRAKSMRLQDSGSYIWFIIMIFIHEVVAYLFFQYKIDIPYSSLLFTRVFPNTVYSTLVLIIVTIFAGRYFSEE